MNILSKILSFIFVATMLLSCDKSDNDTVELRDYQEQYITDLANIEEYMKTHYMTVVSNPGQPDDMDVIFTKIPEGGSQVSVWDQTDYPVQTREISVDHGDSEVSYKIYFLKLREGSGKKPCNVDNVFAGYRGEYIYKETTTVDNVTTTEVLGKQFEENKNSQTKFLLYGGVIRGWSEIFPQFRTGTYSENPDGTISHNDFGAGVMFLPSGLAYFGTSKSTIPSYSPLIFTIKLFELERTDQDGDGIPSYLEDLNGDGYMYLLKKGVSNIDNTDEADEKDGNYIPDFLDADDDGDGYLTSYEIKNLSATPIYTYPFDEIPTCGTSGNGKKRHLDKTCHN
ncbi:FKBP-type peptidyl-prolyl cis-trans isomerase [Flavobacterium solisilvae]|uniref:FKBP-type peptidylprolyl isomerase n=1 Tax=Flavobacterium solisilvae TaxID=1852019 RepID=A0ABX1QV21_9FLAO|nr:FKBP-type peptidylprolyl isomerase [Flavobacterium solisilvae]NMH26120.1 FKBP-type peptidylprolyl isomerase [Flavobacterium solisilvae]